MLLNERRQYKGLGGNDIRGNERQRNTLNRPQGRNKMTNQNGFRGGTEDYSEGREIGHLSDMGDRHITQGGIHGRIL